MGGLLPSGNDPGVPDHLRARELGLSAMLKVAVKVVHPRFAAARLEGTSSQRTTEPFNADLGKSSRRRRLSGAPSGLVHQALEFLFIHRLARLPGPKLYGERVDYLLHIDAVVHEGSQHCPARGTGQQI
jgi:hypothetical protein